MGKIFVRNVKIDVPESQIENLVENYFVENPISTNEPLLAAHISSPTPHPAYDNLAEGRFITYLRNGMH